jgi:hypothetical protein
MKTIYFVTKAEKRTYGAKRPRLEVENYEGYEDYKTAEALAQANNLRADKDTEYRVSSINLQKVS